MTRLLAGGAAVVAAMALSAQAAIAAPKTIKLSERQTAFHEADNAPRGPSASDRITIKGVLYRSGQAVGHDKVVCTGDRHCRATLTFGGGALRGRGTQTGNAFSVAIIGGSGRFAHARGTIHVVLRQGGASYTIRLR
jgi:hypothetical protein